MMSADPASITLTAHGADNELKIFGTRSVPGNVNIWKEKKLFVFG
jgi:hypothetical protein